MKIYIKKYLSHNNSIAKNYIIELFIKKSQKNNFIKIWKYNNWKYYIDEILWKTIANILYKDDIKFEEFKGIK